MGSTALADESGEPVLVDRGQAPGGFGEGGIAADDAAAVLIDIETDSHHLHLAVKSK